MLVSPIIGEVAGGEDGRHALQTKRRQRDLDFLLADCNARLAANREDVEALLTRGSLRMRKGTSMSSNHGHAA